MIMKLHHLSLSRGHVIFAQSLVIVHKISVKWLCYDNGADSNFDTMRLLDELQEI